MAAATDTDHWRTQWSPNGDEADRILYNWTQGGRDNGFSTPGYASTTWTAPLAAGTYTLTCTIYDDATIPQNDEQGGVSNPSSSRTDAPVVRTVNVIVVPPCGIWSHVRWESGGTVTWTDPEGTPTISDALARQSWSDSCANTTKADRTVGVAYAK